MEKELRVAGCWIPGVVLTILAEDRGMERRTKGDRRERHRRGRVPDANTETERGARSDQVAAGGAAHRGGGDDAGPQPRGELRAGVPAVARAGDRPGHADARRRGRAEELCVAGGGAGAGGWGPGLSPAGVLGV